MASAADIESSLEMREILQLEVQTLTKDEETLDNEKAALRLKKDEMNEKIESQKVFSYMARYYLSCALFFVHDEIYFVVNYSSSRVSVVCMYVCMYVYVPLFYGFSRWDNF